MTGTLHLVGVGPGDPELLTLKAVRILGSTPVIAYPSSGEDKAVAYTIASRYVTSGAEHLPLLIPMERRRARGQAAYDAAATLLLGRLRTGRDVAYVCEGDPLFYGSGMYLCTRIAGRAPIAIVPGITSLTAAAAAIARPLAARNEMLKILPAPLPDDVLGPELERTPAAAIIKVGRHFDRIRALLATTGHAPGAMVVEHATSARERITPLSRFNFEERPYFSTILCYRGEEAWGSRSLGA
jgi:precorrin-2/cobalt-factor-2 C20-methyltransferase